MSWVTELAAALLVAGALVLLGLGRISFEQALSLITLGIGIVAGKHLSRLDTYLRRRYGSRFLARKYSKYISEIVVGDKSVTIYVLPEFLETKIAGKIVKSAWEVFPGMTVEVEKGERVRLV